MKSKLVLGMAASAIGLLAIVAPASAANHRINKCNYALLAKNTVIPDLGSENFRNHRAPSPDETNYEGSREDSEIDANRNSGTIEDVDGSSGGGNEAP